MNIIISTFGESPGGILECIKNFPCDKLILIIPDKPQHKKSISGLKRIEKTTHYMNIATKKIRLSPYMVSDNINIIKKLILSFNSDDVILNITGGRKTLSLAATIAGFLSNPKKIVYFKEEDNKPIEIPRFTIEKKILSAEKREVLRCIGDNTNSEEIRELLGNRIKYPNLMKHLRELVEAELVKMEGGRPQTYSLTPSGLLLR